MKRRLFAALAGCLTFPGIGWTQESSWIPPAPVIPTIAPAVILKDTTPHRTTPVPTRPSSPYNLSTLPINRSFADRPRVPPSLDIPLPRVVTPPIGTRSSGGFETPVTTPPLFGSTVNPPPKNDTVAVPQPMMTLPEQIVTAPVNPPVMEMRDPGNGTNIVPLPSRPMMQQPTMTNRSIPQPMMTNNLPQPPSVTVQTQPQLVPGTAMPMRTTFPSTPPMPNSQTFSTPPAKLTAQAGMGNTPTLPNPSVMPNPVITNSPMITSPDGMVNPNGMNTYTQPHVTTYRNGSTGNILDAMRSPGYAGPSQGGRFWVVPEYLYWTAKGANTPPLVTASPVGTPRNQAGVLGTPGTQVLFGGQDILDDYRSGVRVRTGLWLDPCQRFGVEAGFFYLEQENESFTAASNGNPAISRPFFNIAPNRNTQFAQLVAFANPIGTAPATTLSPVLSGRVTVDSFQDFWGAELNGRLNLSNSCCSRLDLLVGYRYLRMRDGISIREDLVATDPTNANVPVGTRILVLDQFDATSSFNGGQIGLAGEYNFGRYSVGLRGTVALGNTRREVGINGITRVTLPDGSSTTSTGGLLAQRTNIGRYTSDQFSVVPELGINLGYNVTERLRLFAGYNFLYWNNVVRASEQIDFAVNETVIPRPANPTVLNGPARPAFIQRDTDFWVHGVSFGLEFRY